MRPKLTLSVALAAPVTSAADRRLTAQGIAEVKAGTRDIEVRVGVGIPPKSLPARCLAHAACVAEVMRTDLPALLGKATRVRVFSTAPKAMTSNDAIALASVATFGLALRACNVQPQIELELSAREDEVPANIQVNFSEQEHRWLSSAATRSRNGADPTRYAIEHASRSLFGDLDVDGNAFRITIGPVPEARFWAFRSRVRSAALALGYAVTPAAALILRSCRVPWYSPTANEPTFATAQTIGEAILALDAAANPSLGGNVGLKREARMLHRFSGTETYEYLRETHALLVRDVSAILNLGFDLGINARQAIASGAGT